MSYDRMAQLDIKPDISQLHPPMGNSFGSSHQRFYDHQQYGMMGYASSPMSSLGSPGE